MAKDAFLFSVNYIIRTFLKILMTFLFVSPSNSAICDPKSYYDNDTGKCKNCSRCPSNKIELTPCQQTQNTICGDISDLEDYFPFIKKSSDNLEQKEKSTNFPSLRDSSTKDSVHVKTKWPSSESSNSTTGLSPSTPAPESWVTITLVVVSLLLILLIGITFTFAYQMRHSRESAHTDSPQKLSQRARLFSRDRLSTSDYKNALDNLNCRLAMDELLGSKQERTNNEYVDEVFVETPTESEKQLL